MLVPEANGSRMPKSSACVCPAARVTFHVIWLPLIDAAVGHVPATLVAGGSMAITWTVALSPVLRTIALNRTSSPPA